MILRRIMICKDTNQQMKLIPKKSLNSKEIAQTHISQGILEYFNHLELCEYIFIALLE